MPGPGWAEIFATLAVGLLAGAGGLAGIVHFFVRPRVYRDYRYWDLVVTTDPERKRRAEAALASQNLPSAIVEVEWWNSGRRRAKDIVVDVKVPGIVLERQMLPESQDDVDAPWEYEARAPAGCVRVKQSQFRPGGGWAKRCKLTVGYQRLHPSQEPDVRVYQGDRQVGPERTGAVMMSVGQSVAGLAAGAIVAVLVLASVEARDRMFTWITPLLAVAAVVALTGNILAWRARLKRTRAP